jgi:hypothetical protein
MYHFTANCASTLAHHRLLLLLLLQSYAFAHDALVWWTVLYQLLRLAQLAESLMSGMR